MRLAELEELYHRIPVGLCVIDRELRFVRVNDAYVRISGFSREDLIGKRIGEIIPESVRDEAIALVTRVMESGEPVSDVEQHRHIPGEPERERFCLVNVHPERRQGEVTGAIVVLQDVTTMRHAEEAERQRRAEIESVYRNAPVGLSFVDPELHYLRVNQMIADMNGVRVEDMIGKHYSDLSPETAKRAEPFLRALMAKGETVRNLAVRSKPPADPENLHDYLLSMDPVRDAEGEVVGFTSVVQDVTDVRQAEEKAAQRLAELETLYANMPVGLCHLDADLRIVHLNPLFARLSGRPLAEQVGASAAEVLPPEIGTQLVPRLRYVAASGASLSHIEIHGGGADPDARALTWMAQAHPLKAGDGRLSGIVLVIHDVSPLADRQREIEAVRDRLAEAQHVARVGSWEWNLIEDEIWWSPELYEIFGRTASYVPTFDGLFEQIHPDDQGKAREQLDATLTTDEPYRITFRMTRVDGSERVLFTAARLERNEGGMPARLIGTCQDVTEYGPLQPRRKRRGKRSRKR